MTIHKIDVFCGQDFLVSASPRIIATNIFSQPRNYISFIMAESLLVKNPTLRCLATCDKELYIRLYTDERLDPSIAANQADRMQRLISKGRFLGRAFYINE